MKTIRLLILAAFTLPAFSFAREAEAISTGDQKAQVTPAKASERPVARRAPATTTTYSSNWSWNNRPCDSIACRAVRFPWGSAPGS